jgi:hypothetical protein
MSLGHPAPMHQSIQEPPAREKRAMFNAYVRGREDAEEGEPCDPTSFNTMYERRKYAEGYWMRVSSLAFASLISE